MSTTTIKCRDCGKDYTYESRRGRPAVRCEACKEKFIGNKTGDALDKVSLELATEDLPGEIPAAEESEPEAEKTPAKPKDPGIVYTYYVHVTNMGWAYEGEDEKAAKKTYDDFVIKSTAGFGQVGHARVTMFDKGEQVYDFYPKT